MSKKRIHFVGVGGIGVSALARFFLSKGNVVSGSDLSSSEITCSLENEGVEIFSSHSSSNIKKEIDFVIYSPAVSQRNPELEKARDLGIRVLSYPEALGEITKDYYTIAVSGTHGKSTTCAMLSLALERAGLDPTAILGTKLKEFGNRNFRAGQSRYLIIEADEWQASFLNYSPQIIVLTNIEKEHLDFYKDLDDILKTFGTYVKKIPSTGLLVANKEDKNIKKVLADFSSEKVRFFSIRQEESKTLRKILRVPGDHNICNALAVLSVCRFLRIKDELTYRALSRYRGSWRRFETEEKSFDSKKVTLISDYGHHPTELRATLSAAREKFSQKRIFCVFQPHQIQRTHYLFNDFVRALSEAPADEIIVTDIYHVAGREGKSVEERVDSQKLVKKIGKERIKYLKKEEIVPYLKKNLGNGDVLIIMGAGDIYRMKQEF